jgi:hypothetical protein
MKNTNNNPHILCLDLETRRLDNGNLEVISSAIYDGIDYYTFYLTDYINQEELLITTTKVLIDPKYNNYQVYIHNFSLFDAIFLFKYILALDKQGYLIEILKREDKFIKITIGKELSRDRYFEIALFDSYLLLPSSLSTLSETFGVAGKLTHNILNHSNANLYDPTFRSNLLAYNKQDCKALYDVMVAFNSNFKELFNTTIFNSPTLPSLALFD